jgi:hypothetical protein
VHGSDRSISQTVVIFRQESSFTGLRPEGRLFFKNMVNREPIGVGIWCGRLLVSGRGELGDWRALLGAGGGLKKMHKVLDLSGERMG